MSRTDSYRQKVYNAEQAWVRQDESKMLVLNEDGKKFGLSITVEDAQLVLDSLAKSFGVEPVVIRTNRRLQQWAGWYARRGVAATGYMPTIEVNSRIFSYKTLLHEFAHHLDAERRENYDGKGHGGSFTEAMLNVVELHLGREAMATLLRSYEQHGALVGASESRKVADRTQSGVAKRQSRHGAIEEAWAIKVHSQMFPGDVYWLEQDKMGTTTHITRAGVWKRQATAEKVVEQASAKGWNVEVVKVTAQLDTLYSNRWWAIDEAES